MYKELLFKFKAKCFISSRSELLGFNRPTFLDKSLTTLVYFYSICQGNLSVRPPPSDSMLFIVMNSSLFVSNIVGLGGGGVPYSSDAISYCFKIACQRMFQLSDPGVLRTFVVDCTRDELA